MVRLDVRGAAGEKHPIEPLEQLIEAQLLGECGNEERRGARSVHHGPGVLLANHVKGVCADDAPVGRDTN
jgi:hypothetical protein